MPAHIDIKVAMLAVAALAAALVLMNPPTEMPAQIIIPSYWPN